MNAPTLRPGPWLAERIQIAFVAALALAVVLILTTGWGLT